MPYYHVYIIRRGTEYVEHDQSENSVLKLADLYMKGENFIFSGTTFDPFEIEKLRIYVTGRVDRDFTGKASDVGTDVTRNFVTSPPRKAQTSVTSVPEKKSISINIFIVHGHDDKPKLELARMLERLGLNVIILSEQPDKGRTVIEKLEQETMDIGYAFVILTPDDIGYEDLIKELSKQYPLVSEFVKSRPVVSSLLKPRARQNVILELGYFVGKIGRNRVCCLYRGDVELPSDIHGVIFKKFNNSVEECYKAILDELKGAGYEIKP